MSHRSRGAVLLPLLFVVGTAAADDKAGALLGWVEDTEGFPAAGAVVSLFGRGLQGAGIVTLADGTGRFSLPSLPAGSYTLRALARDRRQMAARQVTVLPNQDSVFTLNLTEPAEDEETTAQKTETAAVRELRWLLRHKKRSLLEDHGTEVARAETAPASPRLEPGLAGNVEVVTSPAGLGVGDDASGTDGSLGVLRLHGRFLDHGQWSLGGLLSESATTTWRMAAEFIVEPLEGHRVQAGGGYGTRFLRPIVPGDSFSRLDNRSGGVLFAQDEWALASRVSVTMGLRYSYVGFLAERNHLDPTLAVEYHDGRTRVHAARTVHTLSPGGDILTLSSLASVPAMAAAVMDDSLQSERLTHYNLGAEQSRGPHTFGTEVFYEATQNQLTNVFEGPVPRTLRIVNGSGLVARGVGVSYSGHVGNALTGSVCYRYGHASRASGDGTVGVADLDPALAFGHAGFHDVVARVETFVDRSGTRITAYYRVNRSQQDAALGSAAPVTSSRFDVRLSQGLPFLATLTRADWELLLAYRNLFYEPGEGGVLDELAVIRPPIRMVGGISVRF